MNYEKTTIGLHCTVTSSKRFHASERTKDGVPFYCSKEIIKKVNGEKITECDYISEDAYNRVKEEYGVPQTGDLLITTRGTYGIPYIYKEYDKFYFADGNLTWLKDFDDKLDAEYLYYWINSYEGQKKIDAIAKGKTKYNEIQMTTGMSDISFCLKNLIAAEIVERRETPKPYYVISDSMVNFYFKYVAPGVSLINSGKGKLYFEQKVKQKLHQFMGSVFEKMAKEYILGNVGTKKVPCFLTDVVEYQNSIKAGKEIKTVEIDLLGLDGKKYVLAGECKFKSEKLDKEDLENFQEKLNYLPASNLKTMLFSLSGFTDYVIENSKNMALVTLEKMY